MRFFTGALLMAALTGCAASGPRERAHGGPMHDRAVVAVEVFNLGTASVDVYYGSRFLGVLSPRDRSSFGLPPGTKRARVYSVPSGQAFRMGSNVSGHRLDVRYRYEDQHSSAD